MSCDWCWIIIVSGGVYKVCGVCNFVFFFAATIVNSFNFISNLFCFGTEWKCWFEMHEDVYSGGFSIETSVNFTNLWYLYFKILERWGPRVIWMFYLKLNVTMFWNFSYMAVASSLVDVNMTILSIYPVKNMYNGQMGSALVVSYMKWLECWIYWIPCVVLILVCKNFCCKWNKYCLR